MSSPTSSVASVHVNRPMRGMSIGYCPGCGTKAPKGGYKLSMQCSECGYRMGAKDFPKAKHLSEAFPAIRLGEAGKDGKRRSWIMYMPLGTFHHPEYGDLHFTEQLLGEVKQHFDNGTRGIEIALDEDHGSSRDNTAATGWIERMAFRQAQGDDPAGLWAYVRWTPLGIEDIQSEKYKYFSPEYGNHLNELTGHKVANVPFGGGLTNRPFLKVMPAVKLMEVSRKPWSSVDKSTLPRACFLIQGDPEVKSTWKLPVYESDGKGGRGALNINGVKAALGAIHGARSGQNMTGVPAGTVAKLTRWLTQYGGGQQEMEEPMPQQQRYVLDEEDEEETRVFASKGKSADDEEMDDPEAGMAYADTEDAEDEADGGDDEEAEGEAPTPPKKKPAAKKMSEGSLRGMTRTQLAERTIVLERQAAVLEQQMRQLAAEKRVTTTLASWNDGTLAFSEKKPRQAAVAITLSPRFERAYQNLMFSEGVQALDEQTVALLNRTIELALSGAVINLEGYGNSSELEAPHSVQRVSKRANPEDAEKLLMETAADLARRDGKQFREFGTLPGTEQAQYMSEAAERIGYRG